VTELITEAAFLRVLIITAITAPLLAILGWLVVRKTVVRGDYGAGKRRTTALTLLLLGFTGPVLLALWFLYSGVMAAYGFDSVKALLINAALFLVLGTLTGWAVGRWHKKADRGVDEPSS
jgi:hypothetical protein